MERKTPAPQLHLLAPELLLKIAGLLLPQDLSRFRLTCQALANAGGSVLLHPNKLSRLYIHPTSVSRFIEICGDETFATNIHQVILLGKRSSDYVPSEVDHLNNHPWPHFLNSTPGRAPSLIELVTTENTPFDVAYKNLVTAVGKLCNVRVVTYAAEVVEAGLNSTSRANIDRCAAAHEDYAEILDTAAGTVPQTHTARDGIGQGSSAHSRRPGQYSYYHKRMVRWSDLSVLTGILLHAPSATRVEVGGPTYGGHDLQDHRLLPSKNQRTSTLRLLQQKLKSIAYGMEIAASRGKYNIFAGTLLAECTGNERVTVYIDTNGHRINSDLTRRSLQGCRHLLSLRHLEIIGIGATPCVLDVGPRLLSTARVTVSVDDLLEFLLQHGTTLSSIRLANVILTKSYGRDVRSGMREGLTLLRQHLVNLDEASLRLQRATCGAECPGFVGRTAVGLCCQADPANDQPGLRKFRASDVEEIGKDFDCPEEDGVWEFGEYLMRKGTD